MNVQVLIDSIVRQVTVLIAQLATVGGVRAPVAHIADEIFVQLSNELAAQGVSRKVSADMFGMALRAYIRKLQRLRSSETQPGSTLWRAILDRLGRGQALSRNEILDAFARDDAAQVAAVLHDLRESGLVFATGSADGTIYRAATETELQQIRKHLSSEGLDELTWALIYREGPLGLAELAARLRMDEPEVEAIVARLCADGRVRASTSGAGLRLLAQDFSVPLEARRGFEAAVFDHFQAVVQTITQRLQAQWGTTRAEDTVGGSTFSYDVWPGHPLEAEVYGALRALRQTQGELLRRVQDHNREHGRPERYEQVVVYAGQCVLPREDENEGRERDD